MHFDKSLSGLGNLPDGAFESSSGECPSGYVKAQGTRCIRWTSKVAELARCAAYSTICLPIPRAPVVASSQPVNISVSPQINTQVSPQISPVFQQQYQPTNSPATAGTTMSSPPAVPLPPAVSQPVGVNESSQLPAAPVPAQGPVYVPAPVSAPVYAMAAPEQLPPAPVSAPAPVSETVYTPAPSTPPFDWKIAAILGAVTIGVVILTGNKKG